MYTKLVKYIYHKYSIQKINVQIDYKQYAKNLWDWIPVVVCFIFCMLLYFESLQGIEPTALPVLSVCQKTGGKGQKGSVIIQENVEDTFSVVQSPIP